MPQFLIKNSHLRELGIFYKKKLKIFDLKNFFCNIKIFLLFKNKKICLKYFFLFFNFLIKILKKIL